MDIKTKLSIGNSIFPIWRNTAKEEIECEVCYGTGYVVLNNSSYECPECHGDGYKTEYKPTCWRIAECSFNGKNKVHRIDIEVVGKKTEIRYFPWGTSGNYFKEEDCFPTLEEAQEECDKRNKEIQSK